MFLISKLGMLPVINFGSRGDEVRRTCRRSATARSQASYCLSEADAGSDVASMTTRAVRDGDDWVITGTKCWITNAGISDLYTVFARTSDDRHKGITCFLVEAEWGVHVDKLEHKLGIKGSPTGVIRFDDVPGARRAGASARSARASPSRCTRSTARGRPSARRPSASPRARSTSRRLHEGAHARSASRSPSNQGLQWMAADCAMRIEAARALVYRACAMVDDGDPTRRARHDRRDGQGFASDVAMQVTTDCVQFLGGYGYTTEFPVERMMRDAKITQIYEGTNQIQRIVIAKKLFS